MELFQANRQWSSRSNDERFVSLTSMLEHFEQIRRVSRETVVSSRKLQVVPTEDNKGLQVFGPNGHGYAPTHWGFGQLAQLAEAPAGYLRTLPAPIAADAINYGLHFKRDIEDVGVLLQKQNDIASLRAVTGPRYGRIWNAQVLDALVNRFGDGRTGHFRVPGEFGKEVAITKANTTLFAGDQDFFVFLADEKNRIEMPNRRNGQHGELARGFFVWNSEVGAATFGVATFLFDYVCCNRIVWGATEYRELRVRHTASAPDRWIDEVAPALEDYANSSTASITKALEHAREARLGDKLDEFLASRFGKRTAVKIKAAHEADEQRPIETMWDVVTGATAFARSIGHQNERIEIERKAGEILDLVAA
jgi:hypothetical protein